MSQNTSATEPALTTSPVATPRRPVLRFVKEYPLLPVLIVVLVVGSFANSLFLSPNNVANILAQSAVLGVLVVSQSLVMLTGRMDLSTESIVTLAPLVAVW